MYLLGQPLLYNYLLLSPSIHASGATWVPGNEIMDYPYYQQRHPHPHHPNLSPSNTSSSQSDSDNSIDTSPRSATTTMTVGGATTASSSAEAPPTSPKNLKCHWSKCQEMTPFRTLSDLAHHVTHAHAQSSAHADGLYRCEWLGCARAMRSFNARYKMLVHVRTHTHEKPHQCAQCAKSFSRAENLKIHWRTHSGEKPYKCPLAGCDKAYSNSSDRFKHVRTHICQRPYKCQIQGCEKSYTDPSSLRKHLKTYKHHHDAFDNAPSVIVNHHCRPVSVSVIKKLTDQQQQKQQCQINLGYCTTTKTTATVYFEEQNPLDLSMRRRTIMRQ